MLFRSGYSYPLKVFSFQYFNGNDWVTLFNETENFKSIYNRKFEMVKASKVRLNIDESADAVIRLYELQVFEKGTTALKSVEQEKFKLYPNPATNYIQIEGVVPKLVEIYNATGNLVLTTNKQFVNLNNFKTGFYFVKVDNSVQKLLIR